eukprot:CAMPEP_0168336916 /NCGR_PEP_ID=MMETSP0213-20121227/11843_1 /TAXON_ID=151035 /ORGANISM="Euplotes harpa, Strain FSP1.4" /LENGTH=215 /DNA_ID=CAMNT_0008342233 /DNA_START=16 /DNA_END=663 /DNA_ORIENTATION=-
MNALLSDDEDEGRADPFNENVCYKVIFIGDSGIGKTSVINRYLSEYFNQFNQMTLQCSFQSKVVTIPNSKKQVKLHIWDTAGDEKFRNIVKMYYRGANVVVLCYDVTSEDSFDNLKTWIEQIDQNLNRDETKVVLCGCKCDLEDSREVETKSALKLAKENEFRLFETSAKEGSGIDYMFVEIARMLYEEPPKPKRKDTVRIASGSQESNNQAKAS